jgi:tetratricopeptide (TPR) repeat protein
MPSGAFAEEIDAVLRQRLADALVDAAVTLVSREDAQPADFDLALELAIRVTELDPACLDCWKLLQQLADITSRHDLSSQAVERIVALDPADEAARLRRLLNHVERGATSEERISTLQSLLDPTVSRTLGAPTASRLAMELALLLRRTGDTQGYASWLAEAVALDPSNPAATSELAGFFSATTDDPGAITELLVARCLADPANLLAFEQLCDFVFARGAFAGSRRLLGVLVQMYGGPLAATPDLLTKLVAAIWGAGDGEEALRLIANRQLDEDDALRRRMDALRRAGEEGFLTPEFTESVLVGLSSTARARLVKVADEGPLTADRIQSITAPLWPELAAARAAILDVRRHPELATAARELVSVQSLFMSAQRASRTLTDAQRLADFAECSWWILFLGNDIPAARAALDETFAAGTLPEEIINRLNGWLALREGRLDEASALFATVAERDPRSRLGEAVLARMRGDRVAAAGAMLDAARRLTGTIEGSWASESLMADLGARAPLWPSTQDVEEQVAAIPASFERLLIDPNRSLNLSIRLAEEAPAPFDRIEVIATVENRSTLPLSLGPGGPLRPTLALPLAATTFGTEKSTGPLPMPLLLDIGQRLRIGAKETLQVRCNIGRIPVRPSLTLSRLLRDLLLTGTSLSLNGQAQLNPIIAAESGMATRLRPGILGVEAPPLTVRLDAVPAERSWRLAAIEGMKVVDRLSDLDAVGTIAFRVAQANRGDIEALPPESRAAFEEAMAEQISALLLALAQLGPRGQAWVAAQLRPNLPHIADLEQALRRSQDPDVRLAVLLALVASPDDPILDETRRGDDRRLRRIAELLTDRLRRDHAKRQ